MRPQLTLKQRLRWELAFKSPPAACAFTAIALVLVVAPFGTQEMALPLRLAALGAIVASVARFFLARAILRGSGSHEADEHFRRLFLVIAANALCWGCIFNASAWELIPKGEAFLLPFSVMVGFLSGSLITLASSARLSIAFTLCTVGLVSALTAWFQLTGRVPQEPALLFFYAVFIAFCLHQAHAQRQQLIARFRNEMRTEIANRLLSLNRQRLQNQTAQAVHASRLASLGEMAGGVAHEINNPLAIISASLEVITLGLQQEGRQMPAGPAEALLRSHRAVGRIAKIVRGLRRLSRNSEQDPKEVVSLQAVLNETLDFCLEKFQAKQIRIELPSSSEAALCVPCRPVEISQILINLLNNAHDAVMAAADRDRWISVAMEARPGFACIRVANSGPPIGLEARARLFQPFYTTKEIGMGTGLGLSISRALAQSHGGDLAFMEVGGHTTFLLSLPLA